MLVHDEYIFWGATVILSVMRHPLARVLSISTSFTCRGIRTATMKQSRGQIVIIGGTRAYCKLVYVRSRPLDSILIVIITSRNSRAARNVDDNNNNETVRDCASVPNAIQFHSIRCLLDAAFTHQKYVAACFCFVNISKQWPLPTLPLAAAYLGCINDYASAYDVRVRECLRLCRIHLVLGWGNRA